MGREVNTAIGLALSLLITAGPVQAAGPGDEIIARPAGVKLPITPYAGERERLAAASGVVAPVMVSTTARAPVAEWEVKASDVTLARTLERWATNAGYKLKWDASRNFLIGASDVYTGSFESALQTVLSSAGIRLSDYPLEACIYTNTPPLVRITRQGEQSRECAAASQ
ncbi:MAG: TcpQ domain-containing protein [Pseudomonadota bacterium]